MIGWDHESAASLPVSGLPLSDCLYPTAYR